ncbi:GNAT family N-acetyltransferase [Pseudomonas typographi]|uniref:GNAT family N-acetyltransferase n=1 Tax=Pseudomonas typographi TaxID=2715964 RepID=A0ABR7YWG2_9PSED|nr:GNAT family N-acetyltransferase [Pseudomonas typographi]MBD1597522.1 GNAT family N-acetyltransferase [Pseudomonas typographi]
MKTHVVDYEALGPLQRQALEQLELPPEQQQYVGGIFAALHALASAAKDDARGFALLVDNAPRGFFVLKHGALLPPWADPGTATLHGLMIDVQWQGRGLGKHCLQALPALARTLWPGVRQLMLSVDPENRPALGLYLSLGWVDCGTAYRSRLGYERRLVLAL